MWHKIKNLLVFVLIAGILVVAYLVFMQKPKSPNLVSSTGQTNTSLPVPEDTEKLSQEFLNLLFSVKSINIDPAVFTNKAFNSLKDSSIVLIPDGTEGRKNPFAPIGTESIQSSLQTSSYLLSEPENKSEVDLLLPNTQTGNNKTNN